jgi:hypothetical protein
MHETKKRLRTTWDNFHKAEHAKKAATHEKAEEERWLKEKRRRKSIQ